MRRFFQKESVAAYVLIMPNSLGLLFLYLLPIVVSFGMSLFSYSGLGAAEFIGFSHFKALAGDGAFLQALWNTLRYVVVVVPLIVIISILVASALNKGIALIGLYRTLFFLPVMTMPVAVAMVWKWLFNMKFGLINQILSGLGLAKIAWLSDPSIILQAIMVIGVWSGIGFNMVILLSGLKSIPESYYEAATLDGASRMRMFFAITLPQLSPSIFFVVIMESIKGFQVFDQIFVILRDNHGVLRDASRSIVLSIYESAFITFKLGYASSQAIVLFIIIFIITLIQFRMQDRWVHYE